MELEIQLKVALLLQKNPLQPTKQPTTTMWRVLLFLLLGNFHGSPSPSPSSSSGGEELAWKISSPLFHPQHQDSLQQQLQQQQQQQPQEQKKKFKLDRC